MPCLKQWELIYRENFSHGSEIQQLPLEDLNCREFQRFFFKIRQQMSTSFTR